ncbi:MAG: peptidyl-prolyl cis-trans isomerase [Acidobacteria bacterium]|jgi:hypothetical protein|nr:peptidyl-prolyl cis-trans isomerase [Acidobacteriota bacterium]MCU0254805.1 peptidyl-prolyl cis-trans isomerase [Acidobacteriota bacterium]
MTLARIAAAAFTLAVVAVPALLAAEGAAPKAPLPQGCIEVQHVLVAFTGSVPGKNVTRTREEAAKLAQEVLDEAKKGADFTALVKKYTADSAPGIYKLCDAEQVPKGFYSRYGMVKGFGDVSFALQPGEVGMAAWSDNDSPYGWHIIKRLQ